MAVSTDNILSGPAQVQVDDVQVSHTQGGIVINVAPQNRMRWVDQFGEATPVDVIHLGDEVTVTCPFAEWTELVLQNIYEPGIAPDQSSSGDEYLGIGRSAGYVYDTRNLKVIPFQTADQNKSAEFWRAVPIGEFEVGFTHDEDRIINTEFSCLADQSKDDGQLVGRLYLDNA